MIDNNHIVKKDFELNSLELGYIMNDKQLTVKQKQCQRLLNDWERKIKTIGSKTTIQEIITR